MKDLNRGGVSEAEAYFLNLFLPLKELCTPKFFRVSPGLRSLYKDRGWNPMRVEYNSTLAICFFAFKMLLTKTFLIRRLPLDRELTRTGKKDLGV
jgi:hypothetical protein